VQVVMRWPGPPAGVTTAILMLAADLLHRHAHGLWMSDKKATSRGCDDCRRFCVLLLMLNCPLIVKCIQVIPEMVAASVIPCCLFRSCNQHNHATSTVADDNDPQHEYAMPAIPCDAPNLTFPWWCSMPVVHDLLLLLACSA